MVGLLGGGGVDGGRGEREEEGFLHGPKEDRKSENHHARVEGMIIVEKKERESEGFHAKEGRRERISFTLFVPRGRGSLLDRAVHCILFSSFLLLIFI